MATISPIIKLTAPSRSQGFLPVCFTGILKLHWLLPRATFLRWLHGRAEGTPRPARQQLSHPVPHTQSHLLPGRCTSTGSPALCASPWRWPLHNSAFCSSVPTIFSLLAPARPPCFSSQAFPQEAFKWPHYTAAHTFSTDSWTMLLPALVFFLPCPS